MQVGDGCVRVLGAALNREHAGDVLLNAQAGFRQVIDFERLERADAPVLAFENVDASIRIHPVRLDFNNPEVRFVALLTYFYVC